MRGEDFAAEARRENDEKDRAARRRADDIAAARDDVVTEARTLRRSTQFTLDWFRSVDRLRDITDRLNELEGAAS